MKAKKRKAREWWLVFLTESPSYIYECYRSEKEVDGMFERRTWRKRSDCEVVQVREVLPKRKR